MVIVVELAVLFLCYVVVLKTAEKILPVEEGEGMRCLLGRMSGPAGSENCTLWHWRFYTETPDTAEKSGQSGCQKRHRKL